MRLIRSIRQQATLSQVVDVLRGANTRAVKDKGHDSLPEHGACKALRCTPPLAALPCPALPRPMLLATTGPSGAP